MNYFLGVDIGTTSSKAVAFSKAGEVICNHSFAYSMYHPQFGWSEQNPDEILKAVVDGINKVTEELAPAQPLFISFSAAMHSLIVVGEQGELLSPCIIWADNRADEVAQKLLHGPEGKAFYLKSGVPIHSMSPLCKLLWLQENNTEVFNKASRFIGIKEYIFYKLFNDFVVDTSIASATGLLNTASLDWDGDILNFIGVNRSRLSKIVATKTTFFYHNTFPGLRLSDKIPFVIGASDGALSNLGTGATGCKALAVTIGTSGAARLVVASPKTDDQMRTFCYHLKDNLYITGGANNNGAVVIQWLKEKLLKTEENYNDLFALAETITAGADDLIFLPYLLGERAPIWNSNAKAVFFGLTIQHQKAHLIRAAMEAVIFSMYSIIKILMEQESVTEIHASGGFAKSPLWLQMLADVTNIKVNVSGTVESSALGAVMLGAEAIGLPLDMKPATVSVHTPDANNQLLYQKQFKKFERLYDLLKSEMQQSSYTDRSKKS